MSLNLIVSAGISVLMAGDIDLVLCQCDSRIAFTPCSKSFLIMYLIYIILSHVVMMYVKYIMSHDVFKIYHHFSFCI